MNEDTGQTPTAGNAASRWGRPHAMEDQVYEIRIWGHLDCSWSDWFEGLSVTHQEDDTTVLTGPVADQPALHGLLLRIRDLGLPLISVNCIEQDEGEEPGA